MKHIFVAIVCLLGSMSLQSCLHDDKEFFDESAANRIESTIENTQKILESSENGWQLHYFTGKGMTGGGYTFLMKFANGKVTVAGDAAIADPTERVTSSYTVDRSMDQCSPSILTTISSISWENLLMVRLKVTRATGSLLLPNLQKTVSS